MKETTRLKVPEPSPTRFDLRCRFLGVPVRITPLFWAASAVLGVRYYAEPEVGGLGLFIFWMAAALLSVLAHNLGQVLVSRLFGARGEVVLYGLGGLSPGIPNLPRRWQRVAALLAGPLVNAVIVALVFSLTLMPFPAFLLAWGWAPPIKTGLTILGLINVYWALLNVLPLWPLTGGQAAHEIGEGLFGRRGVTASLLLSIVVTGILAVCVTHQLSEDLKMRFDERYTLFLEHDSVLLFFCFLVWLRGFRALWPDPPQECPQA